MQLEISSLEIDMAEQQTIDKLISELERKGIITSKADKEVIEENLKSVFSSATELGKKLLGFIDKHYSIIPDLMDYFLKFLEQSKKQQAIDDKLIKDMVAYVKKHKKEIDELVKGFHDIIKNVKTSEIDVAKTAYFFIALVFGLFLLGVSNIAETEYGGNIDYNTLYETVKETAQKIGIKTEKFEKLLEYARTNIRLIKIAKGVFITHTAITAITVGLGIILIVLAIKAKVGLKDTLLTIFGIKYRNFLAQLVQKYSDKETLLKVLVKVYVYLVRTRYVLLFVMIILYTVIKVRGKTFINSISKDISGKGNNE